MEKEFIPYELVLELSELGFEELCIRGWDKNNKILHYPNNDVVLYNPTFSQAFRWFREKFGLHSFIDGAFPWFRYYINSDDNTWEGFKHFIYEEAELECLKKLIDIVKNKKD